MCKLAAISYDESYNNDPLIPAIFMGELLLVQCDGANTDGTGIGICNEENLYIKNYIDAPRFVFSKEVMNYLRKHTKSSPLMGHVRNATNGDKKDGHYLVDDAHPFVYGNIMAAHNGHFANYKDIQKEKNLDLNGSTIDSAVFFRYLANELNKKKFNINTLNKTIKEFEGSFTVLIHDALQPGIIWAAKGTNQLSSYLWEELNLLILATSALDIKEAICNFIPRYNLYKKGDLTIPKNITSSVMETQSLFKIEGLNVEKVADIEKCKYKVTSTYYQSHVGWQGKGVTKPKPAQQRAIILLDLESMLSIDDYGELDVTFKAADIEEWWKVEPKKLYSVVSLVEDYLANVLQTRKNTEALDTLTDLWVTCKQLYRLLISDFESDVMDCYLGISTLVEEIEPNFYVPYFFNDEETLSKIKDCLIGLISSPTEGDNEQI